MPYADEERNKECRRRYMQAHREEFRSYLKSRKERIREINQARRDIAWREFIEEYGGRCACCGERRFEFLTIDHIFGRTDGHDSNRTGKKLALILKNTGWPKGEYQILCWNCNGCKGVYGVCVHELERLEGAT